MQMGFDEEEDVYTKKIAGFKGLDKNKSPLGIIEQDTLHPSYRTFFRYFCGQFIANETFPFIRNIDWFRNR